MKVPRPFKFAELFAGWGGFSTAVEFVGGSNVEVIATLDGYDGAWNVLRDEDFESGKKLCQEVDHLHVAPPCRTLTKARRSDEFGHAKILRSDAQPEGWGDKASLEANLIVCRMVVLCLLVHSAGGTFSVENPWESFLWQLRVMTKLLRLKAAELVLLDQCAYGALSQKPTASSQLPRG